MPGIAVAEHWRKTAGVTKDLAILRSLTSKEGNHGRATYLLHTSYAPSGGISHPGIGDVTVIGLVGEPASVFADDPGARVIAAAVTEPLVALNSRGEFVPRLAADVPTIENGGLTFSTGDPSAPNGQLVATFRLRDGLVWQDGAPITAEDVRFAHDGAA